MTSRQLQLPGLAIALAALALVALHADPAACLQTRSGAEPGAGDPGPPAEEQPDAPEAEEEEAEGRRSGIEEEVVVSASRAEESVLDAPAPVSVLTGREVAEAPAQALPDVLRRTPGMNVVQFSSRDYNLVSRGASSSLATNQQVLVDGRSIYLDFFGFVMWETLPFQSDELEQVEVVRGPGSAVWGANALNGVVNFRTRSPRELAGMQAVSVGGGEMESADLSFLTASAHEKVSWKLSAGYHQQDEPWPRPRLAPSGLELPEVENTGFRNPKLDLRIDRDNDGGGRASMQIGATRTSGLIHTGIGPFDIDDSTGLWWGRGSWERGSTEILFFVNVVDGDAVNVLNELPFAFDTWTYDLSGRSAAHIGDRHRLVYGANLRYNDFDLSIAPRGTRRRELGAFATDEWLLSESWSLHLGARADWFDTIGSVVSPRAALLWRPHQDHSVRFSWNRAYRAPSLVNDFLDTTIFLGFPIGGCEPDSVFPVAAVGNPDLTETRLSAWEIGYTGRWGRHWSFQASAYLNETRDLVDLHPTGHYSSTDQPEDWCGPGFLLDQPEVRKLFPKVLTYRNVAVVKDRGTEVSLEGAWSRWRGWLSWSWQDASEIDEGPAEDALDQFAVNVPPRNRFSLGGTYEAPRWGGTLSWDWIGRAFWSDVLSEPFWGDSERISLVGARLWWKTAQGRLTWSVAGTNLLDDTDPQHPFGDEVGRLVRTNLSVRF